MIKRDLSCPAFTDEQLAHLALIFQELGQEINNRANRAYCSEGSASIEALANVGSVIETFDPKYVVIYDDHERN